MEEFDIVAGDFLAAWKVTSMLMLSANPVSLIDKNCQEFHPLHDLDMESLKICLDGIELACVPVGSFSLDDWAREVVWRGEGIEILASVCNETLSFQILCERESVLVFAGKVTGPVTFECKVADGKKLTLNLH